jgi:AraC family transcriptional regulator
LSAQEIMNTDQLSTNGEFDAILRGPSQSRASSRGLNWNGYLTERHLAEPGERPEAISERYILGLWRGVLPVCEYGKGSGNFVSYGKQPGSMTIVPPGIVPAVRPQSQCDIILCALEPDFIEGIEAELDRRPITEPFYRRGFVDPALSRLAELLSLEASQGGPSGRLYSDHLANAMALRLLHLGGQDFREGSRKSSGLPSHRLRRVVERMQDLHSDLDLHTLAAESGYSRSHFLRMFRASMGCTPHQHLLKLRLDRAKELMRVKSRPLIDIAAACGFSSHAHLSRVFRQMTGMSPSEYRRNL